jgi:hypothetical protein
LSSSRDVENHQCVLQADRRDVGTSGRWGPLWCSQWAAEGHLPCGS